MEIKTKIALTADWLVSYAGAERVIKELIDMKEQREQILRSIR